ncbi:unnamed protein product [Caenorhabditis auriculariae]|uniref:Uncharacterized protein n=1 Tax=Caenorhabditis auriculariae TaxID=2777116 RepID=A0A8S1H9P5_9PELO|nr:unnamed protein product [Caenorhabditis auriculariae]
MVYSSPSPPVPVSLEPLHTKMLNAIESHIAADPNAVAFVCAEDNNVRLTFREYREKAKNCAQFLSDRGFGHKNVLCQVLPNGLEYPVVLLGVLQCGGTMSGASAMFTDYELERQFLDSRCTAVATDEAHLPKVMQAAERCPQIKTILCVRKGNKSLPKGVFAYDEAIRTKFRGLPPYKFSPDDVALLPYSSGTTGSPKGVMLSHKNFGTMVEVVQAHQNQYISSFLSNNGNKFQWRGQPLCLMLPFYHIYGMGLLMNTVLEGLQGIVFKKFEPTIFLENIQKFKVQILFLVPPILLFLAKHPVAEKFDLSSLRVVISGAAPAGKDLCQEFTRKYPKARIAQAYGMTECGMASHIADFKQSDDYTSVGIVLNNFEQKVVDVTTGAEVPLGQRGEICVRSPTVMLGYLNRPEATAETIDKDGWLHTGDIGYLGKDLRMNIVDRLKELIKVKGLQVPPAELEDLLLSHPKIGDAAVIGIKDERCGEVPMAFVVRQDESLTIKDVLKFVEGKVSSYKWLAGGVEFLKEIPKAPSGKILRRFLRDEVARREKARL